MDPDLAMEARRLLDHDAETAEHIVADRTSRAIAALRLDEAMFWQRVRFTSRMLRARRGGGPRDADGPGADGKGGTGC